MNFVASLLQTSYLVYHQKNKQIKISNPQLCHYPFVTRESEKEKLEIIFDFNIKPLRAYNYVLRGFSPRLLFVCISNLEGQITTQTEIFFMKWLFKIFLVEELTYSSKIGFYMFIIYSLYRYSLLKSLLNIYLYQFFP